MAANTLLLKDMVCRKSGGPPPCPITKSVRSKVADPPPKGKTGDGITTVSRRVPVAPQPKKTPPMTGVTEKPITPTAGLLSPGPLSTMATFPGAPLKVISSPNAEGGLKYSARISDVIQRKRWWASCKQVLGFLLISAEPENNSALRRKIVLRDQRTFI